jgi:hypothetical protein
LQGYDDHQHVLLALLHGCTHARMNV